MKVKQLVWEKGTFDGEFIVFAHASPLIYRYEITDTYYARCICCSYQLDDNDDCELSDGDYKDYDAAKAACQQHYEELIMSGLETEDE